jgi:hypothetical protein
MTDLPHLAAPARRALANAGVARLEDLTRFTEADVAALHGMGPKAITALKAAMAAARLRFSAGRKV